MSRGWRANYAYCVTGYPHLADAQPGSRPAPELDRARQLARERAGLGPVPAGGDEPRRDEVAVLADVLARDGTARSATETLRAELANADHLGVLGSIWYDLTRRAQAARFTEALRDALPGALAEEALADPACTWLWRSLRHAEATGLDGASTLRKAITAREVTSARNIARVLDARVRRLAAGRPAAVLGAWADRVPPVADPDIGRYLREVGEAMDDRTRRIGEHAAATQPAWALLTLGPLPAEPDGAAAWQQRAAVIGAYRELYGIESQTDAIGPALAVTSPEAWADWHTAFAALGRIGGLDLRAVSDGQLHLRRAAYQRELAWAPPYVAEDLRLVRLQARTAWENTIRSQHAARAATAPDTKARHADLARVWGAMHAKATDIAATLASAHETRRQWATLTEPTRAMARAADAELRRRHPDAHADQGQPTSHTLSQPEGTTAPAVPSSPNLGELDINPAVADRLAQIADHARRAQQQLDYLASLPEYTDEHQTIYAGPAWDVLARRQREAIIQPPKPEITPATAVLARAQTRTAEPEPELEAG
jgi:hypothetical protein